MKGLGAEPVGAARYRAASRRALVGALRAARVQGVYEGVTIGMSGVFLVVVAWIGGHMALDGTITIGELVSALGLTQFLVGPLSRLVWSGGELARGAGSAGRIAALLNAEHAVPEGAEPLPAPRGAVSLRGVHLRSLRGVDLEVEAGEIVGVVAEDPVDAQALLACLGRTEDPERGEVLVDGRPLRSLRLHDGRGAVLAEPHDTDLFEGTLGENVDVAGDGAAPWPALVAAAADEVVDGLPEGLDAPLGEDGRSLSGGQRQRVALARALHADPPVLVLHDPTTAVDAATEDRIASRLAELRAGRTTILAHDEPGAPVGHDRAIVVARRRRRRRRDAPRARRGGRRLPRGGAVVTAPERRLLPTATPGPDPRGHARAAPGAARARDPHVRRPDRRDRRRPRRPGDPRPDRRRRRRRRLGVGPRRPRRRRCSPPRSARRPCRASG